MPEAELVTKRDELPAVQKLGEEVGMNIGGGLKGLTAPLDGGSEPPAAPSGETKNNKS